jgi:CRP/FNR family cyclic AMP-dependent transcriptional regulator
MNALQKFISKYPVKKFERDQVIICQDDLPEFIYVIKKGYVKGYDINSQGSEQLVWFGSPGDIFPNTALFAESPMSQLFFSSFSRLEAYCVDRAALNEFLIQDKEALMAVTQKMTASMKDLVDRLNAVEKPRADEKIVHTLLFLADRFAERRHKGNMRKITLPFTQQDLASLVGLTRETVAKELKRLKDERYIYYNRWRFLVYRERLEELI